MKIELKQNNKKCTYSTMKIGKHVLKTMITSVKYYNEAESIRLSKAYKETGNI